MKPSGPESVADRVRNVAPTIEMFPVRTPTLPPATHTNTFLVGTKEAVIVEPATPYREGQGGVVHGVQAARWRGVEPVAILATHHPPDHVGGAMALRERLQLPLWAHAMTAQRLDGIVTEIVNVRAIGQGAEPAVKAKSQRADIAVNLRDRRDGDGAPCPIDDKGFEGVNFVAIKDRRIGAAGRGLEAIGEALLELAGGAGVGMDRNPPPAPARGDAESVEAGEGGGAGVGVDDPAGACGRRLTAELAE